MKLSFSRYMVVGAALAVPVLAVRRVVGRAIPSAAPPPPSLWRPPIPPRRRSTDHR